MTDRITRYAELVAGGDIPAGPPVRGIAKRHLRDLKRTDVSYVSQKAQRGIDWFENNLILRGKPFRLYEWQAFLIGCLHGWKRPDGTRRFRRSYIETAKGSGKTPLVAGLSLDLSFAEGEPEAEAYVVARTMEQALVTYRDLVNMSQASAWIRKRTRVMGYAAPYNIIYPRTGAFIRRLAAQDQGAGRSGYRPHCVIIDEYHEHTTAAMHDMMLAGFKSRAQPLMLVTTNAGSAIGSACGLEHSYAVRVATGEIEDDLYFPYVCALDEGDEKMLDSEDGAERRDVWLKTNPSLSGHLTDTGDWTMDGIPTWEYVENMLKMSQGMPSKRALVERLQFCIWSDAEDPWIDSHALDAVFTKDFQPEGDCYAGIDLSARTDLTAGALVWYDGENYHAEVTIWTPEDTMYQRAETDAAPYPQWHDEGHLRVVPGKTMSYDPIALWLKDAIEDHGLRHVAADAWRMDVLEREFADLGVDAQKANAAGTSFGNLTMHPHPEGFVARGLSGLQMNTSIEAFENAILRGKIRIKANPAVRSAILGSAAIADASSNRRFNKAKSTTRIDACIALTKAIGLAAMMVDKMFDPGGLNVVEE